VRLLWKSKKDGAYALALSGGSLFIGTGGRGRLYRVALTDRFPLSIDAKVSAAEITGMVAGSKGLLVSTSTPGSLLRLGAGRAREGVYLTEPLDAKRPARYGALRAVVDTPASTSVRLALRHGNTSTIDDTWGPWTERRPDETEQDKGLSRFVQVRVTLRGVEARSPMLKALELAYRVGNRPPRLKPVKVLAPGVRVEPMPDDEPKGRTFSVSGDSFDDFIFVPGKAVVPEDAKPRARQTFERGWRTAVWEGLDEDGDRLSFDVYLQSLEEERTITLGRDLDQGFITFAADRLPDGRYRVRVEASDSPVNTAAEALRAVRESDPFVIDHTSPRLSRLRASPVDGGVRIGFEVSDGSPLRGAWCSQDGSAWIAMAAEDGMADEGRENFSGVVSISAGKKVKATVVRCAAEDIVGNRGLSEIRVR